MKSSNCEKGILHTLWGVPGDTAITESPNSRATGIVVKMPCHVCGLLVSDVP